MLRPSNIEDTTPASLPSTTSSSSLVSSTTTVTTGTDRSTNDALLLYRRCNQAAESIRDGNYDAAMGMLEILLSDYQASLQIGTPTNRNGDTLVSLSCYFLLSQQQVKEGITEDKRSSTNGTTTDRVFMSPIYIGFEGERTDGAATRRVPPRCEVVISYVLLYNLALCYHLKASTAATTTPSSSSSSTAMDATNTSPPSYWVKALRLYEIAYTLFRSHHNNDDTHNVENITFKMLLRQPIEYHALVLLCNMGHIHHAMGNKPYQLQCYEILASTMFHIIVNGNPSGNDLHEVEHHPRGEVVPSPLTDMMDKFLYTIMPFISTKPSAPAA